MEKGVKQTRVDMAIVYLWGAKNVLVRVLLNIL